MAKLKKPLLSLQAIGSLAKAISFRRSRGKTIAEKKPEVPDAKTLAQLSWRHMYQKAVALWHSLGAEEKQEWESLARPKHMTGFAWFVSQALKPNPGLYLPLQGGKMAGDIDLDKHRVLKLPLPIDDQEAASKKYHDDNLPVGGYTEGCSVSRTVLQSIPDAFYTYLSFDSEVYDTDNMHDLVVNPEHITIQTAGIYLIVFHGAFDDNAVGNRRCYLRQNDFLKLQMRQDAELTQRTTFNLTTILQLAIGQYLRVQVYQNSGGALDFLRAPNYSPVFSAQRIG